MHCFLGQDVLAFGVCGAVRFPVAPFSCAAYSLCEDPCKCVRLSFVLRVCVCVCVCVRLIDE